MGDKEDKRAAFQIAHLCKTPYCDFCPISDGCELSFHKNDVQCWGRFHDWYRSVDDDNARLEAEQGHDRED